jgi:23S rRNA (cytosine1962-C5)-methyltransferase
MSKQLNNKIDISLQKREALIQAPYETAFRLLNGFAEGVPDLIIEIFGRTIVFHDHSSNVSTKHHPDLDVILAIIREKLPWIRCGLLKKRRSSDTKERNGTLLFGSNIDKKIKENGVWYAVNLALNLDASFYLDTRNLRIWLKENTAEKAVLNTFAYTGSLGIAALLGNASEVMQLDLNKNFLTLAKRSAVLNGKEVKTSQYQTGDFWSRINQYKKMEKRFDCVIVDPPVYAQTFKGTIDIVKKYDKIINKVRPLINDGGTLITINNALFQSGKEHYAVLTDLCKSGYLTIEKTIDVPEDCIGEPTRLKKDLPANPAPYNHPTKITILRVKKKD